MEKDTMTEKKMDTHSVKFYGFFEANNIPSHIQVAEYRDVENPKARMDREAEKYIEFINTIDKPSLNILDFGGGLGGHYLTLKEHTTKNINYHIVERPQSFTMKYDEVYYYPFVEMAAASFSGEIDCLYSNATIFLTQTKSAIECIHDFCKTSANHILLQRTVICEDENYNHFYTYEPIGPTYFSIISEKHLIEICESYGYELCHIDPIYTKFIIENAPADLGVICYKDYLFKKKIGDIK